MLTSLVPSELATLYNCYLVACIRNGATIIKECWRQRERIVMFT